MTSKIPPRAIRFPAGSDLLSWYQEYAKRIGLSVNAALIIGLMQHRERVEGNPDRADAASGRRVLIIDPDGSRRAETLPAGNPAALRGLIGGHPHVVTGTYHGEAWQAWMEDDGKPRRLRPNPLATTMIRDLGYTFTFLGHVAGRVIFTGHDGADVPRPVVAYAEELHDRLADAAGPTREETPG